MAKTRRVRIESLVLDGVPPAQRAAIAGSVRSAVADAVAKGPPSATVLSPAIGKAISAALKAPRREGGT